MASARTGTSAVTAASMAAVLRGRADADRVAERDLEAAHVGEAARDPRHRRRGDLALVGAADHAGDVAAHPHAAAPACATTGRNRSRLSAIEQLMFLCEKRLRGGAEHGDLLGTRGQRRLQALEVRHQHRVAHARPLAHRAQHLVAARHLRHPFRRDEGARLDHRQPGLGQRLDQRHLGRDRHRRRLVLQPVARADLDDGDLGRHRGEQVAASRRRLRRLQVEQHAPSSTWSPSRTCTAVTTPVARRLEAALHLHGLEHRQRLALRAPGRPSPPAAWSPCPASGP